MSNTRFNPTASGDWRNGILHLGHVYLCLVNEHAAHSTNGRFIVRFDDNQKYWRKALGEPVIADNCKQIIAELAWLGVQVDEWIYQSECETITQHAIHRAFPGLIEPDEHTQAPVLIREDSPQYPYAPYLTAEVALLDSWSDIDLLIAGDELLGRYALYCYMSERMGLKQIQHVYLPRLRNGGELDVISKTVGSYKVESYRKRGYTPDGIRELLRDACLKRWADGWDYHNVQCQPLIDVVYS